MSPESTGIIAARSIGLLFLLAGLVHSLALVQDYLVHRDSLPGVGWSNYEPVDELGDDPVPMDSLHLHDTYYVVGPSIIPVLTVIFGLIFLLLSKPIGRLLSRGIAD